METTATGFEGIDFDVLRQIDQEIDDAMVRGDWSQERFAFLYAKALKATAGNTEALRFLHEIADPRWPIDAGRGLGLRRLPRDVRELIGRLSDGWEPFLSVSNGSALLWNNQKFDVSNVEVDIQPDSATLTAHLKPNSHGYTDNFFDRRVIFRDTLHAEFAHGWKLDSALAVITNRSVKYSAMGRLATLRFRAHDFHLTRGEVEPSLWVIPLGSDISIPPFQNISWERIIFDRKGYDSSNGFIGIRINGSFPYVLLKVKRAENKNVSFLIIEKMGVRAAGDSLDHDLLALQFALGQTLSFGLAFGICGLNVIAVRQVTQWGSRKINVSTVPLSPTFGLPYQKQDIEKYCFIDFFQHLSTALREEQSQPLAAALHIFLQSFDNILDMSAQELLSGISILSFQRDSALNTTHGNRAKKYLASYGVKLPNSIEENLDYVANQIAARGAITLGVDEDEKARCVSLLAEIRTVLIAMVSLKVGYRGPIVGDSHTNQSPSWWPTANYPLDMDFWSASLAPENTIYGLLSEQVLILLERPEHLQIAQWLLNAAKIPIDRLKFDSTAGHEGLVSRVQHLAASNEKIVVVTSSSAIHIPTAIETIRSELKVSNTNLKLCPAVPCMEAWLLADDGLLRAQDIDEETLQRVTGVLPEELSDARILVHQIFGPSDLWNEIPAPDIYRAAERSPSLRRFLETVLNLLNIKQNLPAQSVSRAISRSAIAGLMRDLLDKDVIAWRTSDDNTYTAEALANEIEQGTEAGRQYTVDLVSMMINTLSRKARLKGQ